MESSRSVLHTGLLRDVWARLCNIDHHNSNVWQLKREEDGSGENKEQFILMKGRKTKETVTSSSLQEFKRRKEDYKKCQTMFGSFLAPSSTVWADESQERTKILLVIILHLQLFNASFVKFVCNIIMLVIVIDVLQYLRSCFPTIYKVWVKQSLWGRR